MNFSFEEKLEAVKYYLKYGSYKIPKEYDTRSRKHTYRNYIKHWKSQYLQDGEEGLKHKKFNKVYSPVEKYVMIEPIMKHEVSLTQQSYLTKINMGQLGAWIKKYNENGLDGLKCSKRGRPSKNMESNKKDSKENIEQNPPEASIADLQQKIKELEHQNLLLQAELDYRKKLQALVEERKKREHKKKTKSSMNSSKAINTTRN